MSWKLEQAHVVVIKSIRDYFRLFSASEDTGIEMKSAIEADVTSTRSFVFFISVMKTTTVNESQLIYRVIP